MSRTFGAKDSKPRPLTSASLAQKQNAWAKALEAKKVGEGAGFVKEKIKDGYSHLKVIKQNVDCSSCEVRTVCKFIEIVKSGELQKCPLYSIYRDAIIDVTKQPLMYLSKTAGRLEVAIQKQQMLDRMEGKPISKEMLMATKIALDAVKISQAAEKGVSKRGGKRFVGEQEDVVIDAEAFEVKE